MKWWWKSLKHFFNFYPSEKRGVLILMSTFFILLIIKDKVIGILLGDSEIHIVDKIELIHPSYFDTLSCINFNTIYIKQVDSITEHRTVDKRLLEQIIINRNKYGAFNCISDLLDVNGIHSDNLVWFYELCEPSFFHCSSININTATPEEVSFFFRININKGKTLVKYRNSIGGFVKFEQIIQVYGFPKSKLSDEWKARVQFGNKPLEKFNLKQASYKTLLKHGFVNRKAASALNKLLKQRPLTIEDIRNNVSDLNKPLVIYYFKE